MKQIVSTLLHLRRLRCCLLMSEKVLWNPDGASVVLR